MQPLVSIILSCFNSSRYLKQTIDSILAQTHENWELIAVDDCSADNTLEILRSYADRDPRIKIIRHEKNAGRPGITRNTGLAQARGSYIQFIDHDDVYTPSKTQRLLEALLRHPDCCAAFGNLDYIDAQDVPQGKYLVKLVADAQAYLVRQHGNEFVFGHRFFAFQASRYGALHTNSCLIAKDRVKNEPVCFATEYLICEDTDLWTRLSMEGPVCYVDETVGSYRIHGTNITGNRVRYFEDTAKLMRVNLRRMAGRLTTEESAALTHRLADTLDSLGWAHRCHKHHAQAFLAYLRALRIEPSLSRVIPALKAWLPARIH